MKTTAPMATCPMFKRNTESFSEENFSKLRSIMYEQKTTAGSHIFWEGEKADKLYYIQQGQVKVTKTTEDGRNFVLYLFQAGDLFGELDCLGNMTYSFEAEASTDCLLGVIQQRDMEILLWQHGDLAIEMMKWMSLMHKITQTKFRDLMLYGKTGALCSTLIRLSNTYGQDSEEGIRLSKRITNSELGEMIGATRESVNRMLKDLSNEEAVFTEKGHLVIQDLDFLKEVCHCEGCPKEICRV